jgi:prephenate dehydratase
VAASSDPTCPISTFVSCASWAGVAALSQHPSPSLSYITQELHGTGALCSRRAAELYGLDVIEEGVQDVKDNITRFLVLSRWGCRLAHH